jgi:hypothetical protein
LSIWRKGRYLVVLRSVSFLPEFCVKCGEPTKSTIKRSFQYRNPLSLLPTLLCLPLGVLFISTKTSSMTLRVPLCRSHLLRLRLFTVVSLLVLLGSIPVGYLIGGDPGVWTGLVGLIVGLALFIVSSSMIRPVSMTDREATYTGFGEPYLRRFGEKGG